MIGKFLQILHTALIVLLLFTVSCTNRPTKPESSIPEWVFGNISENGICYVGSSKRHIRGIAYQRALAVSRALEGIARQKNITINTQIEHYMSGTSYSAQSSLNSYSVQTTEGEQINAKIKKTWLNPETKEIFILMCED
jgi:hypothetical protein